jgi:hypothetical protein
MATRYWLGAAAPVTEVKYFVFGGTWLTGNTASIAINGKMLTLTTTASMTLAQMAQAMYAMLTGGAAVNGEVRDCVGTSVGEFAILSVSYSATAYWVRLEGKANGRPIGTVTPDKSSVGGTFASGGGTDRTGTGPNHWDNVDNWDADTVPVAADDIIFDHRASAGPQFSMSLAYAPASITVTQGFRHEIGLPAVNTLSASTPFDEPNGQYLVFTSCANVRIDALASKNIKLDFSSTGAASTIVVDSTGQSYETNVAPLLIKGNYASNSLTVNDGRVGVCVEPKTAGSFGTIVIGGQGSPSVEIGDTVTLATVTVDSGSAKFRTAITTLTQNGGTIEHIGGNIGGTTVNINGGTFYPKTIGTYATVNHAKGTIDCTRDARSTRTFANYYMYGGVLKDPAGTIAFTNGLRLYTKLANVTLDLPAIKRFSLSAV